MTDIEIRILGPGDGAVLSEVAPDVFDGPADARWSAEFLADPRHHLAVATDAGRVVGMASAVHYVHPDKAPELWINEVGVSSAHQSQGVGKRLLAALLGRGRELGCAEAWVLTERTNEVARRLYAGSGGRETLEQPVMFEFRLGAGASS